MQADRNGDPLTRPSSTVAIVEHRFSVDAEFAEHSPLLARIVLALLLATVCLHGTFLGFNLSGWAWVAACASAGITLLRRGLGNCAFPVTLWRPWILWTAVYAFGSHEGAIQNAAQILCPIFVGVAASSLRANETVLQSFMRLMRWGSVVFLILIVLVRLPVLLTGALPNVTGLAAHSISALVFQALFLCSFLLGGERKDLLLYAAMAAVPVVAVTRGPVGGSLALALFTLVPLPLTRRVVIGVAAAFLAVVVFYTPRFQDKMFLSGEGTIADLVSGNSDIHLSGRDTMQDMMRDGIREDPWFGKGGNATLTMLRDAEIELEQPHNDWLRITYNYGILGCVIYAGALLFQVRHAWRMAKRAPPQAQVLFYAGLSAFVPYIALMHTDNILIYTQFFGNIQFLMLGLAYGCVQGEEGAQQVGSPLKENFSRPVAAILRNRERG